MSNYYYLATGYSHPDAAVRQRRFEDAMQVMTWLLRKRIWVFAPIVQCHQAAVTFGLPTDFLFWQEYDETMIAKSQGVIVYKAAYWKESKGVASEVLFVRQKNLELLEVVRDEVAGEYLLRDWTEE